MDLSRPVDSVFTKALPKIEALFRAVYRKKAQDPEFTIEDPLVLMPPTKVDYSLQTFFAAFSKSIYQLCNDLESLRYATYSVLQDFLEDGVRYLELRTIPRTSPNSTFTREEYVDTVLNCIEQFQARTHHHTHVYLILAIDRGNSTATEAMEIIDLAISHKSRGVVGIDICGNPTKGDVSIYRNAFAKAKEHGLGITAHFAEVPSSDLAKELETLLSYQPARLGHVIHVPDDLKQEIARRQLGLELCLSCNVHAEMIDGWFPDHHFGYWRHEHCPVVLCTDDVGFFCSPVSNEYLLAAEHFHLSRTDILSICRKSISVIFGEEEEKKRLRGLLDEFEASYES